MLRRKTYSNTGTQLLYIYIYSLKKMSLAIMGPKYWNKPVFLLPSRNLGRLLALSSLNPVLMILTTCLHLSNQTRKFFGKLPTPSYIDPLLLRHAALQKLSSL